MPAPGMKKPARGGLQNGLFYSVYRKPIEGEEGARRSQSLEASDRSRLASSSIFF